MKVDPCMPATENSVEYNLAAELIQCSNQSVFLTGKAGTGKTSFLKHIKSTSTKNTVIVAPTGVAAINAGGTTIHSFFQLPFSPFIPFSNKRISGAVDKHDFLGKLRISSERREVIMQLELLIIDEISMVRCDVLDAIDCVLRFIRKQPGRAFGGVQVLYIGDLYQLPPVIKEQDWKLLGSYYETPFFFSSRVIAEQAPVYIELNKVYRQSENNFIGLLNKVRNNQLDEEAVNMLLSRFKPGFVPGKHDNYITLSTHNHKADEINFHRLKELPGRLYELPASVEGVFNESAYPADETLLIKPGAQVMFLKNDTEKSRRYYNGKIGIVEAVEDDQVRISCESDEGPLSIPLKRETWRNIQYTLDKKNGQVEEEELGAFKQFPIRLAWAITIHKSQGLTFEKAVIDAGSAFAPGQVYVALSRCTSLDGIVLKSMISADRLKSDQRIVQYCSNQERVNVPMLQQAKRVFQQELIAGLFDLNAAGEQLDALMRFVKSQKHPENKAVDWITIVKQQSDPMLKHGKKFMSELQNLFTENKAGIEETVLNGRIISAAGWFISQLDSIKLIIQQLPALTDNRSFAGGFNSRLDHLWELICVYRYRLSLVAENGFNPDIYVKQRNRFARERLDVNVLMDNADYEPGNVAHPELFFELRMKRDAIAEMRGLPLYKICGTIALEQMANHLPVSLNGLEQACNFRKTQLKKFGRDFVDVIRQFCERNGISPQEFDAPEKKQVRHKRQTDTRKTSFDLFKEGKSIAEIARIRNMVPGTIEGHLATFIETGELDIAHLLSTEKLTTISSTIRSEGDGSLKNLKEKLPEYSFGEIRWVLAFLKGGCTTSL